jgi:hypothetical protein
MHGEAGVYTARGIHELRITVDSLAFEGFRIVTVIDTQNGDYHVVAQRAAALGSTDWRPDQWLGYGRE